MSPYIRWVPKLLSHTIFVHTLHSWMHSSVTELRTWTDAWISTVYTLHASMKPHASCPKATLPTLPNAPLIHTLYMHMRVLLANKQLKISPKLTNCSYMYIHTVQVKNVKCFFPMYIYCACIKNIACAVHCMLKVFPTYIYCILSGYIACAVRIVLGATKHIYHTSYKVFVNEQCTHT